MAKLLLLGSFFLTVAALGCGVLHLVEMNDDGDVVFAPRVDTAVLSWWADRAETIAEKASTLDEAAAIDAR